MRRLIAGSQGPRAELQRLPSLHQAGELPGCLWGCDSSALFTYWREKDVLKSAPLPNPMQQAMICFAPGD